MIGRLRGYIFVTFISLFSMDGDLAPMVQLSKLRKKHGFLLVVDDVSFNLPMRSLKAFKFILAVTISTYLL